MRQIIFNSSAFEEFTEWHSKEKLLFNKIANMIKEIQNTPFKGIGNPEPLKHDFKGLWSRHINLEHRLIYEVKEESIRIVSCKFHYKNK